MAEYHYLTIKEIVDCDRYPFTEGQLRHFLIRRHKNGLHNAVRRIGKRLYLRDDLLDQWIESQVVRGGSV